jgi:hypothetical protein
MPNYLTPGVYVEEVPSSQAPIEGVGTAVAAFIGLAPGGPVNVPQRIASWADFVATFGDPANKEGGPFMDGAYLAHAVYGYYENGGQVCWCVRVGAEPAPEPAREAAAAKAGEKPAARPAAGEARGRFAASGLSRSGSGAGRGIGRPVGRR